MKQISFAVAIALLGTGAASMAQAPRDNSNRPCIDVNVQIDKENTSKVRQRCEINVSRTMQAGQENTAETRQTGDVNDNSVDQYEYKAVKRRPRRGQ